MAETPVEVKTAAPAPRPAPASDPWQSLRSEMDRLFDRFSGGFGWPSLRRMFDVEPSWQVGSSFAFSSPVIDLSEDDNAFKIAAELPGLDLQDIDLTVSGDMLVLKGEKRQEKEEEKRNYHFSERSYGVFRRSFQLPASVERDKIAAEFANGVLTITLPKSPAAQAGARKVEVKAAG